MNAIFSELVANVSDKIADTVLEPKGFTSGIHFEDDTWSKLMIRLSEMNKSKESKGSKYPLIALIRNFTLKNDGKTKNYTTSIDLVVANLTDPNWYGDKRRTENFEPLLEPIYSQLMLEVSECGHFLGHVDGYYPHECIDDYHMTEQQSTYKTPDFLDAIIIKGLQLTVKPNFINC